MSDTLPNCPKCKNARKINVGFMDRPCVCTKTKPTGMAQVTAMQSTPSVGEVKPPRIKEPTSTGGLVTSVSISEPEKTNVEPVTQSTEAAQLPKTASSETGGNTAPAQQPKKKGLKKSEVAYKLGRQMGYPDEVIEAIMCEREMDTQQWERKYHHIYLHPLATQLPPNYDPRKWIPGDSARDSFRDMVNQYLPNKPRKISFDEMCPSDLLEEGAL